MLLEEYIPGKEATVGVVEGLRGAPLYVLPPTEIKTGESGVFDYDQSTIRWQKSYAQETSLLTSVMS